MDSLEYSVGRLYVDNYFDVNSKYSAVHMITNIIDEFKLILGEITWMDNESKQKAYDKADSIDTKIGYPDFIKNDTYLDVLYENYKVTAKNSFFQNLIEITLTSSVRHFKSLRSVMNNKGWLIGPAVINAFYSPSSNQICFPAGILQAPFYEASAPKYLNYGGIGSVIGHEITHGFDDKGRLYDKDGIYFPESESLWTNKTVSNYKSKVQCIIDQYSGFTSLQVNLSLNGIQTQGENIADNGGIRESFRAYQKWVGKNGEEPKLPGLDYTPNQLFFINFGQVWCSKFRDQYLLNRILNGHHSPGEFRVIGTTSNSEDFARTFQCRRGQKNNPVKKCSVW